MIVLLTTLNSDSVVVRVTTGRAADVAPDSPDLAGDPDGMRGARHRAVLITVCL